MTVERGKPKRFDVGGVATRSDAETCGQSKLTASHACRALPSIVFYVEPNGNPLAVLVGRGVKQYVSPHDGVQIEYHDAIGEKFTPPDGTLDVIAAPLDWLRDKCRPISMEEAFKLKPALVQRAKETT